MDYSPQGGTAPAALPVEKSGGLLNVVSPSALNEAERAAMIDSANKANLQPVLVGISKHVWDCWEAARNAKGPINARLMAAQRARMGEYDPDKLASIKEFGGSTEYARVTANKCRVADSWLRDVFLGQTEKPWSVKNSPSPTFEPGLMEKVKQQVSMELAQAYASEMPPTPEQVQARMDQLTDMVNTRLEDIAREKAERMDKKLYDQMVEGNWVENFGEFLSDLTTYPAAHFKAPVLRKEQRVTWQQKPDGTWAPSVAEDVIPMFERIDPFRAYPSPGATQPSEGYFIEHITYSREDIFNLIGVEGFNEAAIRAVLDEYGNGGLKDWLGLSAETERAQLLSQSTTGSNRSPDSSIDCIEFHGQVRGKDLLDWGLEASEVADPDRDYEAQVWMVGRWVIKAQLNYDPLKRRPYYKTSYEEIPGSYWGLGLVDILGDVQGIVNAAVRALVNNMGIASGPQVVVNVDRLAGNEDITDIRPWGIWQVNDSQYGGHDPAIQFHQPNTNVNELLTVIEKFYQFGDDWSLIPRYMSGNDRVGGAGRTASGLSMLLNAANKGLKGVVSNIDIRVMKPMLESLYTYNMLYDPDNSIKGDAQIVARGAVSLMQLESLQLRRNEFLQATANPIDSQIVGVEGRAEVLREVAKGLEMDVNRIVPPRAVVEAKMQQQAMAQGQMPQQAPNGETLQNGAAVTDNFSPNKMRSTT